NFGRRGDQEHHAEEHRRRRVHHARRRCRMRVVLRGVRHECADWAVDRGQPRMAHAMTGDVRRETGDGNAGKDAVAHLRAMCGGPRDGALLRVSLANALIEHGDHDAAIEELRRALAFDPDYSAAWKLLGKTLAERGDFANAVDAYQKGIAA